MSGCRCAASPHFHTITSASGRPAKRRDEPGDAQLMQDFQPHVQRWPRPVKRVQLAREKPGLREPARNPSTPLNLSFVDARDSAATTSDTVHWPRLRRLRSPRGKFADRGASTMSGGMGCPWRLHELPAAPSGDPRRLECSVVHSRAAVRRVESQKLDAEALVLPSPNFSRLRVAVWCRAAFWGAAGVLRRRGGGRAAAQLAINSPK